MFPMLDSAYVGTQSLNLFSVALAITMVDHDDGKAQKRSGTKTIL
jgi:hypothetical protein